MPIGLDEIKRRLRKFATVEAAGVSPLYEHLAAKAADDDDVAGLLTDARGGEARGTLLMATAHRLVQADPIHPLSRYYPSVGGFDGVDSETWPLFRSFLLERADKARAIISSRYTQTNEVRRAALVYPAVTTAAKEAGGKIALLEVGCSAGLLLGLDKYAYRYQCGGEQLTAGPAKAAVGLHCALDLAPGAVTPKMPKKLAITARAGLDRAPVDLSDEDELAWLEACVWADQPDRIRLLRTAAAAQGKQRPELITGDAVDDLASAAATLPADVPLVVLTSHVLAYLGERRADFVDALRKLAGDRPLWWVSEEFYGAALEPLLPGRTELADTNGGTAVLGLVRWEGDTPEVRALARTAPHGQRMTWLPA
ncbi:DUF2332 domain-containing protein [Amycolatopsis regifaucium]|uniref:DUF2332 domain-containing protein n=1 Tax=Amycolatopsis regifaucium TaxID=546365 RepID=A0A154MCX9_9PSEU|nr:DUF2332 domain-containing protein [Amycolatopsis regifaucium]KZB82392.1 hypothetical protein AVL48_10795 [Amycolatopsis regifaucium]OKA10211.1 hypothetical protein ATP06_0204755 [Amycolatopsis regifaucium]SFG91587.1 hypothetical protein SAMN04489731_101949 [Amycolatopsis regifaucium]